MSVFNLLKKFAAAKTGMQPGNRPGGLTALLLPVLAKRLDAFVASGGLHALVEQWQHKLQQNSAPAAPAEKGLWSFFKRKTRPQAKQNPKQDNSSGKPRPMAEGNAAAGFTALARKAVPLLVLLVFTSALGKKRP